MCLGSGERWGEAMNRYKKGGRHYNCDMHAVYWEGEKGGGNQKVNT